MLVVAIVATGANASSPSLSNGMSPTSASDDSGNDEEDEENSTGINGYDVVGTRSRWEESDTHDHS